MYDIGRDDYYHQKENRHLIVEAEGKAEAKSVVYPYWMTICRQKPGGQKVMAGTSDSRENNSTNVG